MKGQKIASADLVRGICHTLKVSLGTGLGPYVPQKKQKLPLEGNIELVPPDWRNRPWLQELDDEESTNTVACLLLNSSGPI
jgi:hypothetical protein